MQSGTDCAAGAWGDAAGVAFVDGGNHIRDVAPHGALGFIESVGYKYASPDGLASCRQHFPAGGLQLLEVRPGLGLDVAADERFGATDAEGHPKTTLIRTLIPAGG